LYVVKNSKKQNSSKKTFFILGPTGVGKTDLSYSLATSYSICIINADIGQLYTPLSIGTAKPALPHESIPHYLFNSIDEPGDLSAPLYRQECSKLLASCAQAGQVPVFVGGSFFYTQALFYERFSSSLITTPNRAIRADYTWQDVARIDPIRAAEIHKNDTYRINKAYQLWLATGVRPSAFESRFVPFFDQDREVVIIYLTRERENLYSRINERTVSMLASGWLEETEALSAEWKAFLLRKKIIGYPEIIHFLATGQAQDSQAFKDLTALIAQKTRNYAKRQETYWRMLKKKLVMDLDQRTDLRVTIQEINLTLSSIDLYLDQW
jgi:tRNA dimethylallyltransferase